MLKFTCRSKALQAAIAQAVKLPFTYKPDYTMTFHVSDHTVYVGVQNTTLTQATSVPAHDVVREPEDQDPDKPSAEHLGCFALDGKRFANYLDLFEGDVEVVVKGDEVKVAGDGQSFSFPVSCRYDLDAVRPFHPVLPHGHGLVHNLDPTKLLALLSAAQPFVSDDENRPVLCGIRLDPVEGGMRVRATNAHVLHQDVVEDPFLGPSTACHLSRGLVPPLLPFLRAKGCPPVAYCLHDGVVHVGVGDTVLTHPEQTMPFPNFDAVFPKVLRFHAHFDVEKLSRVLKKVPQPRYDNSVTFTFHDDHVGLAFKDDYADVGFTVPCTWHGPDGLQAAYNADYVLTCTAGMGPKVSLHWNGQQEKRVDDVDVPYDGIHECPCVVTSPDHPHRKRILMPTRLKP